jgi:DNA-binding HxlR family transcriptional regulator
VDADSRTARGEAEGRRAGEAGPETPHVIGRREENRRADEPVVTDQRSCQALIPVFALLGKRWSGLILGTLLVGPARFSEMSRSIDGVSERMLSDRLNELAGAGLVEREVQDGPPVAVVYRLTARGEALRPALDELERWAAEHLLEDVPR